MSKVYTPELEKKIVDAGAFTFASAKAFAEENGLKPKSLIAKIVQMGLPYEAKPKPVAKKVENELPAKKDVLASIFLKVGVELASMERMTVADLMALDDSIAEAEEAAIQEASEAFQPE